MIAIKPGVRIRGMQPEILLAIAVAQEVYRQWSQPSLTITSCTDGDHKPGSLHHIGCAVDLRLPKDAGAEAGICSELRTRLAGEYDVVLEKDHIHVEYDPKR